MKTISHDDINGNMKPETARFYYGKELLLEVTECCVGYALNECVNIFGIEYTIIKVISYPEILIVDYDLIKQ